MTCEIDINGTKRWRNENGELHRLGGLPAIEFGKENKWFDHAKGDKYWYVNGKLHRDNSLPAIEYANGNKFWYVDGKRHRLDGPAVEYTNGKKEWYENGKRHRLGDLPAIEYVDGNKYWYEYDNLHRLSGLPAIEGFNGRIEWYINGKKYKHKQIINYYQILTRFGRYCLKKIKLKQLKRVKFAHVELLGMPLKGKYPGGQDSHKVISYFMNYEKN